MFGFMKYMTTANRTALRKMLDHNIDGYLTLTDGTILEVDFLMNNTIVNLSWCDDDMDDLHDTPIVDLFYYRNTGKLKAYIG